MALLALLGLTVAATDAAPLPGSVPLPRSRPATKPEKAGAVARLAPRPIPPTKAMSAVRAPQPTAARNLSYAQASAGGVLIAPPAGVLSPPPANTASLELAAPASTSVRPTAPLAMAATSTTSPLDLNAVRQAIELVGKNRPDDAGAVEKTITDPLARKLVEWVILRSEDSNAEFSRYAAFIAANPSWPGIATLRRRAEAVMWQNPTDPQAIVAFFKTEPPYTAKGNLALAKVLLAQGNRAGAAAAISAAWRQDGISPDLEAQARELFAGLITPADDKARMDARFYAEDDDAGMRAARHLDSAAMAIAKARAAVINQSANAKAALDAVPASAQHDPGYMFSRIQWLRRADKAAEAARLLIAAPHDAAKLGDLDQWWIERRLVARKLLDLNDAKTAYEVADGAVPPPNENYRAEQQFTAGWIALRFLHQPAIALAHFARIADGVSNPITRARSFYWQGRAAEALEHDQDAKGYFQAAARYPTAYYGQLARSRLNLDEVTLRASPAPPAEYRMLELARAFEILYAVDERDLVAAMAGDLADKATDAPALAALAEIAARHGDARATLLIGKGALGRGMPFEQYAFPDFGVPNYQPIGPAVEPSVVYSIARQESAFNTRVVSSANAIGLMQVTPAAGRNTAKRFNVGFDQRRLMADVAYNTQLGTAELGDDISAFNGSYILAFVAYNAGRHRASEWIEQYGDPRNPKVDPIDWIERIPISETRNYVERVLENMQVYRARLNANSRLSIEADLHRGS